jgi:hypothetical protein
MKIRPVDPDCTMRADGRTDGRTNMTQVLLAFRNFVKASETNKGKGISLFRRAFQFTKYNGPTNALVYNKTLI